jgi:hypothetical protein
MGDAFTLCVTAEFRVFSSSSYAAAVVSSSSFPCLWHFSWHSLGCIERNRKEEEDNEMKEYYYHYY